MKFALTTRTFDSAVNDLLEQASTDTRIRNIMYLNTFPANPYAEVTMVEKMVRARRASGAALEPTIILTHPCDFPRLVQRAHAVEERGEAWESAFDPRIDSMRRRLLSYVPVAVHEFNGRDKKFLRILMTLLACLVEGYQEYARIGIEAFAIDPDFSSSCVMVHTGEYGFMSLISPFEMTENSTAVELLPDDEFSLTQIHPGNSVKLPPASQHEGSFKEKHLRFLANELTRYFKSAEFNRKNFSGELRGYVGFYDIVNRAYEL